MTPPIEEHAGMDYKELGVISGIVASVWVFLKWVFTPLLRESLKKLLDEDLRKIKEAAEVAGKCAERWETVTDKLERLEQDIEHIEGLMTDARENINAMWVIFDNVLGIERRHEVRRRIELPALPNRRRAPRREEDEG